METGRVDQECAIASHHSFLISLNTLINVEGFKMTSPPLSEPVFLVDDQLLQTERQCDGRRKLLRDLKVSVYGDVITVPKDFLTDYSTIPWFGSFIVRWSKVDIAGVVHDYLYQSGKYTRRESDKIWRIIALAGNHRANIFQAWTCWFFLRLGGWWAWMFYRNEKHAHSNKDLLMAENNPTVEAKEPKLTLEAREAVRNYVFSMAVLPGVLSISFAFFLGLMIKDVAISSAQNKATELMLNSVQETQKRVSEVDSELRVIRNDSKEFQDDLQKLKKIASESSDSLKVLGEDPEKTNKLLNALKDAKTLQGFIDRIEKIESPEISENIITYRIYGITNSFQMALFVGDVDTFDTTNTMYEEHLKANPMPKKLIKTGVTYQELKLRPFHIDMLSDRKGDINTKSGSALIPSLKKGKYYIYFGSFDDGGFNIDLALNEQTTKSSISKMFNSGELWPYHVELTNNLKLAIDPLFTVEIK